VSMATMVWIAALVIGLMLLYADVLASFVILRDRELSRLTSILRLLFVWCVPFLGAVLALRVSSEESPHLLPSRRWLWPFISLLSDQPEAFSGNEVIDMMGDSARALPGQAGDLNVGAFNAVTSDTSPSSGGDHE
jgi:hypothetical protein